MTRIVARLEGDGLVTRIPDTSDRRVTHVEPTAKGRELLHRNRARIDAYLRRRMSALPPKDAASLGSAIDLLERLLDEEGS
jgi:DNA-binding MarR family transcriptional regulator